MDKIVINDLRISAKHGVFDFEKENPQEFAIDCVLFLDLHKAGKTDNLEYTVNYGEVCGFIDYVMQNSCFNLLEALSEEICESILQRYEAVEAIELSIVKTNAPIDLEQKSVGVSVFRKWSTAYLSIGSNLGDTKGYLDFAVESLAKSCHTKVNKVSKYITTTPYGNVEQPDFLNGAVEIKTLLNPFELLEFTSSIESEAGREREIHWGPRTLDIDIIFFDDVDIFSNELTIPHIEAHKREFVLKPLCEIAPYKIHPILKKSVYELCDSIEGAKK